MKEQVAVITLEAVPWILLLLLQFGVIGTPWKGSALVVLAFVCCMFTIGVIIAYTEETIPMRCTKGYPKPF